MDITRAALTEIFTAAYIDLNTTCLKTGKIAISCGFFTDHCAAQMSMVLYSLDEILLRDSNFMMGVLEKQAMDLVHKDEKETAKYNLRNLLTLWGPGIILRFCVMMNCLIKPEVTS